MHTLPFDALASEPDTLVLCATARLAQALREQHAAACQAAGQKRWATLVCRTADQWLEQLAEELALRGAATDGPLVSTVLDATQESLLWERVIQEDLGHEAAEHLFDVSAMARSAAEAHALTRVWNVACDSAQASEETRRFADWQSRFEALCAAQGWTVAHAVQRATVQALGRTPALPLPQRVVLAGFNRINPLEDALLQALQSRGVELAQLQPADVAASVQARSYPDNDAEMLAAAQWAQERLQLQPEGRFAIVVPDLGAQRSGLQHTLEDTLAPHCLRAAHAESPRPFNISLGLPLDRYALVGTALRLLDCLCQPHQVTQAQLGELLRSPFWSQHTQEAGARAAAEAELRKALPPAASLGRYRQFLVHWSAHSDQPMEHTLAHLEALEQAAAGLRKRRLPSAWAALLQRSLQGSGWLAGRSLSSHEFQTRSTWAEVLQSLARQDALLGLCEGRRAVSLLRRLCRERIFQPQTEGRPRLQVLGLLEASGLQLDAVWVMGMTDSAWPPAARPNPLLSAAAQRDVRSPNASAPVQLEFARAVLQQLSRAGKELVFSWPRSEGSAALAASPLLAPWQPAQECAAPNSGHWVTAALQAPSALAAPMDDSMAPPVQPGEAVRGGTWLLRAQALCPAWAFYQYRLGAGRLEEPVEGLDARSRGTMVHDSLEHFWTEVQTSTALHALGAEGRLAALERAVDAVLQAYDADPRHEPLRARFRVLERQRLLRLLGGWLEVELQRSLPFDVVACERAVQLSIEGIQVKMKMDRIDQLDDGRLLVIDYKTGAALDTRNWARARITEPQLPIYAALSPPPEGPVAGVAFAKVLMDRAGWAGLACEDGLLPKVHGYTSRHWARHFDANHFPSWDSITEHWRQSITTVAREVGAGVAAVRFDDARALQYCDVLPLLRLAERQAQLQMPPTGAAA